MAQISVSQETERLHRVVAHAEASVERQWDKYETLESDAQRALEDPRYFDTPKPADLSSRVTAPSRHLATMMLGAQSRLIRAQAALIAALEGGE